jgi:hypothetical protein
MKQPETYDEEKKVPVQGEGYFLPDTEVWKFLKQVFTWLSLKGNENKDEVTKKIKAELDKAQAQAEGIKSPSPDTQQRITWLESILSKFIRIVPEQYKTPAEVMPPKKKKKMEFAPEVKQEGASNPELKQARQFHFALNCILKQEWVVTRSGGSTVLQLKYSGDPNSKDPEFLQSLKKNLRSLTQGLQHLNIKMEVGGKGAQYLIQIPSNQMKKDIIQYLLLNKIIDQIKEFIPDHNNNGKIVPEIHQAQFLLLAESCGVKLDRSVPGQLLISNETINQVKQRLSSIEASFPTKATQTEVRHTDRQKAQPVDLSPFRGKKDDLSPIAENTPNPFVINPNPFLPTASTHHHEPVAVDEQSQRATSATTS